MSNLLVTSSLILGMGLFVVGQLPINVFDNVKGWANLGAVGVFGFLFYVMLRHTIPNMNKASKESVEAVSNTMAEMNKSNQEVLDKISERNHQGRGEIANALTNLKVQCAITQAENKYKPNKESSLPQQVESTES